MDSIRKMIVAFALAAASAFQVSYADEVELVRVNLVYKLDGQDMFKTQAIAKPGSEGILTLKHETNPRQYQLRFLVSDIGVSKKGIPKASLSVQVFDGKEGAWVLRSSPRAVVALGQQAAMAGPVQFSGGAMGQYDLSATVSVMTAEEATVLLGKSDFDLKQCDIDSRDAPKPDAVVPDSKIRAMCCSSACAAGSIWYGYYLSCCNVISCCDCGTCCEP